MQWGGGLRLRGDAKRWHRSLFLLLICAVLMIDSVSSALDDSTTSQAMEKIFASVQTLLLAALDDDDWDDPANAAKIGAAISALEQMGSELESQEGDGTASFAFFGRSLSWGSANLAVRHRAGDSVSARNQLFSLVHTCVGCHSRLPSDRDSSLSKRFVSDARIAALPLHERAILETATRQFEAALANYEAILQSPDYTPEEIDRLGIFDEYLALCLHVRVDTARPHRNLEAASKRDDVDAALGKRLRGWLKDLEKIKSQGDRRDLAGIRARVERTEALSSSHSERELLVAYLDSAAVLHRFVEDATRTSVERAEAYYLLGLVESRVGRVYWPAPEEFYLEVAIRMAPGSDVARTAFKLYEELVTLGYSGSAGTQMPPEMVSRLKDLRELSR